MDKNLLKKNNLTIIIIILNIFIIIDYSLFAQDSLIIWNENRPLNWDDFKIKKEYSKNMSKIFNIPTSAGVSLEIIVLPSYNKQKDTNYIFLPVVYPFKSWSIEKKETKYGIRHEQLHFDIAKLYALKMEQAIKNIKSGKEKRRIIDSLLDIHWKLQKKYDKETIHSMRHTQQKLWEIKIRDSLRKFDYYKRKIDTLKCRTLRKGKFKYIIKNDLLDTIMARQYLIAKVNDSIQEIEYLDTGLKAVQKIKWISPCAFIAYDTKIIKKSNSPYFSNIEPDEDIVVEILKADGNRFIGEYVKGGFFFVPVEIIQLE